MSLCSHPLFGLHKCSVSVDECQWVPLFPHEGIQWHTFASSALLCQTPFCQTAPLLHSVTQQPHITEYWSEGSTSIAIPPTSASDVVGQRYKIQGIIFKAALVPLFKMHNCWKTLPYDTGTVLSSRMLCLSGNSLFGQGLYIFIYISCAVFQISGIRNQVLN